MHEKETVVSPSTLVPLGAAVAAVAFALGGVWWAADLQARVKYTSTQVGELRNDVKDLRGDISLIKSRLGSPTSISTR